MDDQDTIRVTVATIARTLGDGWRPAEDPGGLWEAGLHGHGGVILDVHGFRMRHADPLRMEIRGRFPPADPSPASEGITCAAARGGQAIARDIQTRLLPAFTAQLDGVQAAVALQDRDDAALAAVMSKVTQILGMPGCGHSYGTGLQVNLFEGGCAHGHVRGHGDGTFLDLDLHGVPAAVALRMLAVMAAAGPPEKNKEGRPFC